jgi:hypothetical protein
MTARVDLAHQHFSDRLAASLPGKKRLYDRSALFRDVPERIRTSCQQDQNDWNARVEDRFEECLLFAGETQVCCVASFTGGAAAEEVGSVSENDNRDIRVRRHPDRVRDLQCAFIHDMASGRVGHRAAADTHLIEDRGDVDSDFSVRVMYADVSRK